LGEKPAKLFAESQMRPDDSQRLGVEVRHINSVADRPFEQRGANRLCNLDADAFLRFRSRSAQMRSENEVRRPAQRRINRQRFGLEDIQRRAGYVPILQRFGERLFVDQAAASAVDDADAAFCFLQSDNIEKMTCFRGQWCVQRNEIGARKQIVDVVNQLDLQTAGARRGKIGIVSDDAHPESDRAPAQFAADATHSDNAECFVVELDAFEIFFVPMFAADVCVGLRNLTGSRKQERKRMFSRGDSVSSRRIQYDDAAACGRFDIDIVHAYAGTSDHAQLRTGI
jgi:hypothetical protein